MKYALVLSLILFGCGRSPVISESPVTSESPVIPVTAAPTPHIELPLRIEFYGEVMTRVDGDKYDEVDSFYGTSSEIPGDAQVLECRLKNQPVYVSLISAERDSAVIRIAFRGESRKVTIRREPATEVLFDADAVKMSISLGKTTVAPFALDDSIFNLPVAVHKLDTSKSAVRIAQHRVLATGTVTPDQAGRVRTLLTGNECLSLHGSDCFDPGMEFIYGKGDDAIHVVVCLACHKIRVANADEKKLDLYYGLNEAGVAVFEALYEEIF